MPKTTEPTIPDLLPGVPRDAEVQGDPGGREGGGGGKRQMREGTGRGSRRNVERRRMGAGWDTEESRRNVERRRMGAGRDTEESRRNVVRRRMGAGRDTEELSVYRKSRDGIWRRSSDQLNASQIKHDHVVWSPAEKCDPGTTINTTVSIQDPNNIHQRLYFPSEEAKCVGKIFIILDNVIISL